ncbi:MAG: hypothetical protein IPJ88_12300 [Myxococcales bacterium]|nr:MAG: hypothetical protein IPJ88_12300 [Myxococcales bacterium]
MGNAVFGSLMVFLYSMEGSGRASALDDGKIVALLAYHAGRKQTTL